MVVVAVLGILATAMIVLINPQAQLAKSKDGRRKADMEQIRSGLELYRADEGSYPVSTGDTAAHCGATTNSLGDPSCSIIYIQNVPRDPLGPKYYYVQASGGYQLYSCAQNASDALAIPVCGTQPCAPPAVRTHFQSVCSSNRYFMVENP